MGLYRWALLRVAGIMGLLKPRRYRVTLFGESLGTYLMPRGHHLANPNGENRPVLTRPFKSSPVLEQFYLYWVEQKADGAAIMVHWVPETPDETESAHRFFNGAHGLRADGTPDPAKQQPLPARTSEELRLIAAVRADPDAEQPYLDYAKFLSAKRDTYGEYLRMTCEVVKLPEGSPQREKLEEKRFEYAQKHGARWTVGLTDLNFFPGFSFAQPENAFYAENFFSKKGVIEEIDLHCEANVFPHNTARFFHAAPFLRRLSINNLDITVADVGAVPQMAQIESLNLMIGGGTADDFRRFAASENLGGLRTLAISYSPAEPDGIAHLADAKWLLQLNSLTLPCGSLSDDGIEAFADSPNIANLRVLIGAMRNLTDRGAGALCRTPHAARLTTYYLDRCPITSAALSALATATFAPRLERIGLSSCPFDVAGARALAGGAFPALQSLSVSGGEWYDQYGEVHRVPPYGDEVLAPLLAAPWFPALTHLDLSSTGATDVTARALAARGCCAVRGLSLHGNQLTDAGVSALMGSKYVTKLTQLSLASNPFGTAGAKAVADAPMTDLEDLNLSDVKIGPAGAKALAASPHLKKLKKLSVSEEHVGLAGREALMKRFGNEVVTCY
ncbi:MAG: hypothetical protein FJ304_05905 [Planctomycetes bacterium]|nr:hypothetical protein [Planctomycetota bacterium]